MSWTLDGRTYHDPAAFQQARRERQARTAAAAAKQARRDAAAVRDRLTRSQRELNEAKGDLRRQHEIHARMETDVAALRRVQQRAQRAHQRLETALRAGLADAASDRGRIDRDLSDLDRRHRAHVRETRRHFEAVHHHIDTGLADAEHRRAAGEDRVMKSVREVDGRLEAERRARLDKEARTHGRAKALIALIAEDLALPATDLGRLDLGEAANDVAGKLSEARRLLAQGDEPAAQALAHTADADRRSLHFKRMRRAAILTASRDDALSRLDAIAADLVEPDVKRFFGPEIREVQQASQRLRAEIVEGYSRWARRAVLADRHERRLALLEREVDIMSASAPLLADATIDRREQAEHLGELLARTHGGVASVDWKLLEEGDPKSALLLDLDFGHSQARARLGLEGGFTVEGFGEATDEGCRTHAEAVVGEVLSHGELHHHEVASAARRSPRLSADATTADSADPDWRGMADRLRTLTRGDL